MDKERDMNNEKAEKQEVDNPSVSYRLANEEAEGGNSPNSGIQLSYWDGGWITFWKNEDDIIK